MAEDHDSYRVKPIHQKLTAAPEEGFAFKAIQAAGFDCPWHTHSEFELILVLQSNGYRVVGDNIEALTAGDLVLVGPGLPHIWQSAPASSGQVVKAQLIQFEPRFLGDGLLSLPALEPIRRLFARASRGIHFVGPTSSAVSALMKEMPGKKGLDRIVLFLEILGLLAQSKDGKILASSSYELHSKPYDQVSIDRMDRVFQFLNARLGEVVRLSEVAHIVSLSEGAFSRFFRIHTGKTFPKFLNELRVGRACHLLVEGDQTITEVAYEAGFTNLANFNRQFLRLKNLSPRAFRLEARRHLQGINP